ncbi:hypothetical protein [Actinoplanes sp. NPDC051494]|uniref:phosphoketolase family protein n=1 Tax=Actinoplanes sp. NPDC051494 TaxID=3363907 RepID=UPI0037BA2E3C
MHGRPDADLFRVRGFIEQGTTTTPFDRTVRNRASRYHLVMDAINARGHRAQGRVRSPARPARGLRGGAGIGRSLLDEAPVRLVILGSGLRAHPEAGARGA